MVQTNYEPTHSYSIFDPSLINALKCKTRINERASNVATMLSAIERDFCRAGAIFCKKINELYSKFKNNLFIVRREDPLTVFNCIVHNTEIAISADPDVKSGELYPNCSLWIPINGNDGLVNALWGGFHELGGIKTIIGFTIENSDCTLIRPRMSREEMKNKIYNDSFAGNPELNRIVTGRVSKKNIVFIIVGIPPKYFPEDSLTDDEYERLEEDKLKVVLRGFQL